MSYDDRYFKSIGRRVRHTYGKSRAKNQRTCKLCGCRRRRRSSGYFYSYPILKLTRAGIKPTGDYTLWSTINPPCVSKK